MDDLWIFGYGSLIFRVDFPIAEQRPAYIKDWSRRFWQGSTDHRGVPGNPGRVVTLVEAPGQTCWGMAYRLASDEREEVLSHLDHREKGGYARLQLPVYFSDNEFSDNDHLTAVTWHATPDNPNYLGDSEPASIAAQIVASEGPSGPNIEYILQLEQALASIGASDDHVSGIADLVRQLAYGEND
ncbi:MAG: gamma-glutamylcyclotransferase [Pseudomonadales bacterium]